MEMVPNRKQAPWITFYGHSYHLTTIHQNIQYNVTLHLVLGCFLDISLHFSCIWRLKIIFIAFVVSSLIIFRGLFHVVRKLFDEIEPN